MIRINLLPAKVSKKQVAGKQQLVLFGLFLAFVLLCNFLWHQSRASDLAGREAKLKRTKEDIAQLDKIIGEVKNIKDQQAALKDKLAVLDKLKAGRQGPVRALDELATLVPKKLWIRKMEEKGGAVTFEGTAASIDDVSALISALKRARYFSSPELGKTAAKSEGKLRLVEFTLTAAVDYTQSVQVAAAAPAAPAAVK
jgi:type IV pilus assembly protein PilN